AREFAKRSPRNIALHIARVPETPPLAPSTHTLGRGSRFGTRGRFAVAAPAAGQAALDFSFTLQSEPVARRACLPSRALISLNAFAMRVPELWAGFSFWRMTRGSLVSASTKLNLAGNFERHL